MSRNASAQHTRMKRRRWIDIVILVAAVYALFIAIWSPPELVSGGDAGDVSSTTWLYISYALGGALGLGGFILVHKAVGLGRAMVFLGGIVMLSGFLALRELTLLAVLSIGLSGLAMLIGGLFMGPMPSPEDEGSRR